MKTIVAYTLRNEDYTATLIRKQGLFWFVQDCDGNELRIPAKAVDETWEEADEPTAEAEIAAVAAEQETPEPVAEAEPPVADEPVAAPMPSLADQAMAGPTTAEPSERMTLAELCDTYGVIPRIARRKLREAAAEGHIDHDHRTGWTFDRNPENIDFIMQIITARQRG